MNDRRVFHEIVHCPRIDDQVQHSEYHPHHHLNIHLFTTKISIYCPEKIQIPLYASMWDRVRMKQPEEVRRVYKIYLMDEDRWLKGKRASDCTQCGECEAHCTQKLPIRVYMTKIAEFLGED